MRKPSGRVARASSIIALLTSLSVSLVACGGAPYNIDNETDRKAMLLDIENALTTGDCVTGLNLSTQLYQSKYSDNDARMAYASAQACNIGIQLYSLLNNLTSASFSSMDDIFRTLVRLFPSKAATDSRYQSSLNATDALQAMLVPGAIIGAADQINPMSNNPGSDLIRDHTQDSNAYMVFISMSVVGTVLNRNGYNPASSPAGLGYHQEVALPWTSRALVKADANQSGCALSTGLLNLTDSINAVAGALSGNTASTLNTIFALLQGGIFAAGTAQCTGVDGYTAQQCADALVRLRYHGACLEQDPAASVAAGIVGAVNASWL